MDYSQLEENLMDLIKEEQVKLGYRKEVIRLYYPLSTLNHFFCSNASADEMQDMLKGFQQYFEEKFAKTDITHTKERFCFVLPEEVSEYVHNNMDENEFIKKLVDLVAKPGCTMEQVMELFRSQQDACIAEPVDNGEFDILIRFENAKDRYYYCFKDEGCHIIYHRYLPEDYEDLGF